MHTFLQTIFSSRIQNHQENDTIQPHVLIFTIPFQGPVNCALKLAELMCLSGIHVTFLNTDHIHRPILRHTDVLTRFSRYPNFRFETISDGLDHHQNPVSADRFEEVTDAINNVTKPLFREMMVSGQLSRKSERPVTVMIPDGVFSFAVEVGIEVSIPVICFETISPCCLWTSYFNLPALIEAGDVPFKGNDLDEPIKIVPGAQDILRRRDLAAFCRFDDIFESEIQRTLKEARAIPQAQGLILNTFEQLDALILPHMRKLCLNIYTIGPLHSLHKARLTTPPTTKTTISNSVWKEDRSCLLWLDKHPPKAVVYVSFGSLSSTTVDQVLEVWHGLVNSEKPFLWVRRPRSIIGGYDETQLPTEIIEHTKEIGLIVDWAPQEEVLTHRVVGAFLTHSEWNSTMESIVEGVPMICWPFSIDQLVNSRFVEENFWEQVILNFKHKENYAFSKLEELWWIDSGLSHQNTTRLYEFLAFCPSLKRLFITVNGNVSSDSLDKHATATNITTTNNHLRKLKYVLIDGDTTREEEIIGIKDTLLEVFGSDARFFAKRNDERLCLMRYFRRQGLAERGNSTKYRYKFVEDIPVESSKIARHPHMG